MCEAMVHPNGDGGVRALDGEIGKMETEGFDNPYELILHQIVSSTFHRGKAMATKSVNSL